MNVCVRARACACVRVCVCVCVCVCVFPYTTSTLIFSLAIMLVGNSSKFNILRYTGYWYYSTQASEIGYWAFNMFLV